MILIINIIQSFRELSGNGKLRKQRHIRFRLLLKVPLVYKLWALKESWNAWSSVCASHPTITKWWSPRGGRFYWAHGHGKYLHVSSRQRRSPQQPFEPSRPNLIRDGLRCLSLLMTNAPRNPNRFAEIFYYRIHPSRNYKEKVHPIETTFLMFSNEGLHSAVQNNHQ